MSQVHIEFVTWRNGRPRFSPSPALRKQGHVGHDLKILEGEGLRWMTEGEALDWSRAFKARREGERGKVREARAKEKARAAAEATRALPRLPKSKSYTLGQMLEDYLVRGLAGLSPSKKKPFSKGTRAKYKVWIHVLELEAPLAWATEARAITRKILRGVYEDLLRTRSVGTAHQVMRVVSAAYGWAIDDEAAGIEINPAQRLNMAKPRPRVRTLSVAGYLHLLATAEELGERAFIIRLVLGVWTAQRISDRLAMNGEDVVDGRWHCTQIKTGARVAVKLAKAVRDRLPDTLVGPIIRTNHNKRQPYSTALDKWREVIAAAAVDMPELAGLNDQDLRDTAVTWMGRAGCSNVEIMSVTGHAFSGAETGILSHYMEFDHELSDQAIGKLEKWFANQVKKLKGAK